MLAFDWEELSLSSKETVLFPSACAVYSTVAQFAAGRRFAKKERLA
jgi:hypothetical protein